jgi:hypothetical protein
METSGIYFGDNHVIVVLNPLGWALGAAIRKPRSAIQCRRPKASL